MPVNRKWPDRGGKPLVYVGVGSVRGGGPLRHGLRSGEGFINAALPTLQFELLFGTCAVHEV